MGALDGVQWGITGAAVLPMGYEYCSHPLPWGCGYCRIPTGGRGAVWGYPYAGNLH